MSWQKVIWLIAFDLRCNEYDAETGDYVACCMFPIFQICNNKQLTQSKNSHLRKDFKVIIHVWLETESDA